jgi:hypothetical protein
VQLLSNRSGITDVFVGRYQATNFPSLDRCIATVLHATIRRNGGTMITRRKQKKLRGKRTPADFVNDDS